MNRMMTMDSCQECKTIRDVECRIVNIDKHGKYLPKVRGWQFRSHSWVHIRPLILENLHGCPDPEMCSCPSQGGGGEVCQYPDSDLSECSSCGQCPCPPETVLQKAKVSLVIDFDTTSCSLFHLRKVCQTLVSTKPKVVIERIPKTVCPHDQPLTEKSGPTPKVNDQKNNFLTRK